jgi:hypothetical protein
MRALRSQKAPADGGVTKGVIGIEEKTPIKPDCRLAHETYRQLISFFLWKINFPAG